MMNNNYLSLSNDIKYELKEYIKVFEIESDIISIVKCELLRNDELNDFQINGNEVSVTKFDNVYDLYYLNYHFNIIIYNNQIVSYTLNYV